MATLSYFLATARLGFRWWAPSDRDLAKSLWSNRQVTRLMSNEACSEQKVSDRLSTELANAVTYQSQYWPLFLLATGEFVGVCGLKPHKPEERIFELGYHLLPEHWGKGVASEAAGAVVEYAFSTLQVAGLYAGHHPDNVASGRVLEKLGFERTGEDFFEPTGLMHPAYRLGPTPKHPSLDQLERGLSLVKQSPADAGVLSMIVRRPRSGEREVVREARLDEVEGLVGDNWRARGSTRTPDGSPNPDMQVTLMNSRVVSLLAGEQSRWPLAGDQLYVDLDLSQESLPAGTRLAVDEATVQITPQPHTGCRKFGERFGVDALKFVNSPNGRQLRLRGVNARVVMAGAVRLGALLRRV